MPTNAAVKKYLIGLSIVFILLAGAGIWFKASLKPKYAGDLGSGILDSLGGTKFEQFTFRTPEVHVNSLEVIAGLTYYTESVPGSYLEYNAGTGELSAKHSQFSKQLLPGDILVFHSPTHTHEKRHAHVVETKNAVVAILEAGLHLHFHEDDHMHLRRPFTGAAYRFHGYLEKHGDQVIYKDSEYNTLKAPKGKHFDHHGHLHDGAPPSDDHGGHGGGHGGGGHGGGHGDGGGVSFSPDTRPGMYKVFYKSYPLGKFYRHLKYECHYVNGVKTGSETFWNPDGSTPWIKTWLSGKLHGRYQIWYDDGHGNTEIIANYENGKRHGDYFEFHPNGVRKLKTKFVHGKLDGLYQTWTDLNYDVIKKRYSVGEPIPLKSSTGGGGGGGGGH